MRVNEQIRVPRVLVIDENGQKIGVMNTREALRLARSKGLDLIEVAPYARPPVCRLMDYGKFKYQQRKREKEARRHQKEMKELRLTPQIGDHDLKVKVRNAEEFLREGHRVRVYMHLRGRWLAHTDLGEAKLKEFADHLNHIATLEVPVTNQGGAIFMILAPRKETREAQKPPEPPPKSQPPPPNTPSPSETS